jgi:hypothetical protein
MEHSGLLAYLAQAVLLGPLLPIMQMNGSAGMMLADVPLPEWKRYHRKYGIFAAQRHSLWHRGVNFVTQAMQ